MDPLSQLLRQLRLSARIFHRSLHCGTWTLEGEYEQKAMFHLVAAGRCELRAGKDVNPILLERGDVIMFPRPTDHILQSVHDPAAVADTLLLCGYFDFESPLAQVVLDVLPSQLVLRHKPGSAVGAGSLLELIIAESATDALGRDVLVDKLADALFVYVVRQGADLGQQHAGLLQGLIDARLGPLLLALHERPAEPWTLARMASVVHLSRAAFVRRFQSVVGRPPMNYLVRWRMHLALMELSERGATVAETGMRAGYATEAAFSRAFKRTFGYPPSAARSA